MLGVVLFKGRSTLAAALFQAQNRERQVSFMSAQLRKLPIPGGGPQDRLETAGPCQS